MDGGYNGRPGPVTMRIVLWIGLGGTVLQGCVNTLLILTILRGMAAHESEGHPKHVRTRGKGGDRQWRE